MHTELAAVNIDLQRTMIRELEERNKALSAQLMAASDPAKSGAPAAIRRHDDEIKRLLNTADALQHKIALEKERVAGLNASIQKVGVGACACVCVGGDLMRRAHRRTSPWRRSAWCKTGWP